MLLAGDSGGNLLLSAGKEFCGHYHVFALCKITESPAQILLAGSALVTDGSIKKIHPKFQTPADNLAGVLLVQSPAVLSVLGIAKSHTPHTDTGNI